MLKIQCIKCDNTFESYHTKQHKTKCPKCEKAEATAKIKSRNVMRNNFF